MSILNERELDEKIAGFMERKMEIFPELRHQPEIHIKESDEQRTITQWLRDTVLPSRSAQQ